MKLLLFVCAIAFITLMGALGFKHPEAIFLAVALIVPAAFSVYVVSSLLENRRLKKKNEEWKKRRE